MARLNWNTEGQEEMGDFSALPAGEYVAFICASEMKPTKAETGHFLELKFEICEGQYAGRNIWTRLNLDNPNAQAVTLAQRELTSITKAVGKVAIADSDELHNVPMLVKLDIEAGKDGKAPQNRVKAYASYGNRTAAPKSAPAASQAATTGSKKPWE